MAIEWKEVTSGYSRLQGVCPFVDWSLGSENSGFFPMDESLPEGQEPRLPVMLRLKGLSPARFASGDDFFDAADQRRRWRARVRVPALYTEPAMEGRTRIVCTALVTRWFFQELERNDRLLAAVIRVTLGLPLRDDSLPEIANDDGEAAR